MTTALLIFKKYIYISIFLHFVVFSSITRAEIFKWVDSEGRTHYSDTNLSLGHSKVEKLTVDTLNISEGHTAAANNSLKQVKPKKNSKTALKHKKKMNRLARVKPSWGGSGPETDQKRCALGRAILTGRARHSNGVPIDTYDLKVAERDVRKFCH